MSGLLLFRAVSVALLILANGFFVAAEFALVSIRDTRIEQMVEAGVPGARAVRRLQQDLDDFLPAVQLGVTLCSLALGWILPVATTERATSPRVTLASLLGSMVVPFTSIASAVPAIANTTTPATISQIQKRLLLRAAATGYPPKREESRSSR